MKWIPLRTVGTSDRSRWTAVVPAAGMGSRLGHSAPKLLYPIGGRSILDWMTSSLTQVVGRVILVVHPSARSQIENEVKKLGSPVEIVCVEQPRPVGMADAVDRGIARVTTDYTWVVWGDQPFLRSEIFEQVSHHVEHDNLSGVIPLVARTMPYVHYQMDSNHRLAAVLQRREKENLPENGLSDVGCFAFHTDSLREILRESTTRTGWITGEWNLLPELPALETKKKGLGFVQFDLDAPECLSINTPEEATFAEKWAQAHPNFTLNSGRHLT